MSIHRVDVINITEIHTHPNPDVIRLGIVRIGGFEIAVNKEQWQVPCLACYIQPDSLVNVERPEFAFLKAQAGNKQMYRVRVKKLQGHYSQGLLIPAPEGLNEGDDAAELLEVEHYEPPMEVNLRGGTNVRAPRIKVIHESAVVGEQEVFSPVYDIENFNRFINCLEHGEEVIATEKIHGANARFTCVDGQLFVGSRTQWKAEAEDSAWWIALKNHPEIIEFLKATQGAVLYGEIYGRVQNLRYGLENDIKIALFDILNGNRWVSFDATQRIAETWNLPWVPVVYRGPFDKDELRRLAELDSSVATAKSGHIREGLVVKPFNERSDGKLGRVILKMISNRYLDKT